MTILQHLLNSIPVVKQITGWSKREGSQLHRHIEHALRDALLWLNSSLAAPERISARLHAWLSNVFSVTPSGVFRPHDSAIIILGDIEGTGNSGLGLGRAIALSFSELGYTVLMLSTTTSEPPASGVTEKSSAVLSLLYAWHKKKERSPSANWGTVAPITLDTHSPAQRTQASETVHAYCHDHALQLCALIVLPPTSHAGGGFGIRQHTHLSIKASEEDSLAFAMWGEDVESASGEPLLIMRDYFDLLMKASGRVILMSRCLPYNPRGTDHLLDGMRECLAMNLNQTLEPLGVRVCSLTTGAPEDFGEFPSTPSRAHDGTTVTNATKTRPSAEKITPGMTNTDGALPETPYFSAVCDVLESITSAAYPKTVYTVGYRPWLWWAWRVAPDAVRLLFRP